jgi:hypothetical protein
MTKEHSPMTFEILSGTTSDFHVERVGACECCGFMEQGLVCWKTGQDVHVECEECLHQAAPDNFPELRAVFMPELSHKAFSNYVRVLAWLTFAARVDRLHGHDFAKGTLPRRFATGEAWNAQFRWASLAEGLEDRYAGHVARAGLRQARDAFAFISLRIRNTETARGSSSVAIVKQKGLRARLPGDVARHIDGAHPFLGSAGKHVQTFRSKNRK